jgi:cation diffusion facilitator family transporter
MRRLALGTNPQDPAKTLSTLKTRAAAASIATSLALAVVKLAAGFASGSLALLSEGAHNALDIGASTLTFFAVREAAKPADADHPFGHAKIEAVAALAETGFLAALSIGVAIEAIERIREGGAAVDANAFAISAIVFSIAADSLRWRALTHVARVTSSHALLADALHFSSDLISSTLVLFGLAATRAGYPHADALAAIGVAGFIAAAGYRLGRTTIDALVDRAPEGLTDAVRALVINTRGVAGIDAIRLRPSGAKIVGEILISVSRTLPLERVAAIKADALARITRRWPQADVTITANPLALDDETILERVLLIAARRHLPVHHVTIQDIEGRKSVALDLEVDGAMSLGDAHRLASELEDAIAEEIGDGVEVETHIEPAEPEASVPSAEPDLVRRIEASLASAAASQGSLRDIHNVRVRETSGGVIVLFHCRVDPATPVEDVHEAVDSVERAVREAFPEARRVVGHAEPAGTGGGL